MFGFGAGFGYSSAVDILLVPSILFSEVAPSEFRPVGFVGGVL